MSIVCLMRFIYIYNHSLTAHPPFLSNEERKMKVIFPFLRDENCFSRRVFPFWGTWKAYLPTSDSGGMKKSRLFSGILPDPELWGYNPTKTVSSTHFLLIPFFRSLEIKMIPEVYYRRHTDERKIVSQWTGEKVGSLCSFLCVSRFLAIEALQMLGILPGIKVFEWSKTRFCSRFGRCQ